MIQFTVPAIPIAQPRQRHRIVAAAGRQFVSNYTPTKSPVNAFKAAVQHEAAAVYHGAPLDGALQMAVAFVMPRPKSKIRKRGPNDSYPHTGKPDIDNLLKSLKDSLSGLLWRDDAQVAKVTALKRVASGDEQPHCVVIIDSLNEAIQ